MKYIFTQYIFVYAL